MRSIWMVFLFTMLWSVGYSQINPTDYSLTVDFGPAFHYSSELVIKNTADSTYIGFVIQLDSTGKKLKLSKKITKPSLAKLSEFLKTYKFQIRGSADTTGIIRHTQPDGKDWIIYQVTNYTDGINTDGQLVQNGFVKKFAFWAPKKDPENQKLIEILFSIMKKSIKKKNAVDYLNAVESYYHL